MDRRQFLMAGGSLAVSGLAVAGERSLGGLFGAGAKALKAATLSDEQVRQYGAQMASYYDQRARIAPFSDPYAKRLLAVTRGLDEDQGLALNYKVYLTQDINAHVTPDGSVRLYSGLMDMMDDDELRFVIGHEIGHVAHQHQRKRLQTALTASAAQDAAVASGNDRVARLADSALGDLIVKVITAQHSQGNEKQADDYGLAFMGRRKFSRPASVSALDKLARLSDAKAAWLSTHPDPKKRAERLRRAV
ncbi:M48 family metalloprotease [Pseudomarimonas arenosa]|uniref:M48 family metalloprotease n=1 Tax=Pseudomarimonas arenosa TaxID=2774145 RepID=A0AAW3ZK60_9GAMM|nr:M48 family metalloprotease [Pseudomarimonas arenosa]MBD8525845.1 M48 family metalloprotease [Pseudomarimonas arenosa]